MNIMKKKKYLSFFHIQKLLASNKFLYIVNLCLSDVNATKKLYSLCKEEGLFINQVKLNLIKNYIFNKTLHNFFSGSVHLIILNEYSNSIYKLLFNNPKINIQCILLKNKIINPKYIVTNNAKLSYIKDKKALIFLFTKFILHKQIIFFFTPLLRLFNLISHICPR